MIERSTDLGQPHALAGGNPIERLGDEAARRIKAGETAKKHLAAYLDEFAFRFYHRTAKNLSHRFARFVERAVHTKRATYRAIIATPRPAGGSWIATLGFIRADYLLRAGRTKGLLIRSRAGSSVTG